jgi:hypothetical protein
MHSPTPLVIAPFGSGGPLAARQTTQVDYLRGYLADLGAATIVEEQSYFDRDYLSEFAAFYGVSASGYSNLCRRLHFFSAPITRSDLESAAGGDAARLQALQHHYLGFIVLRPIPQAPLGRTVLKWYVDQEPATPRVTNPSRRYVCNIAGLQLSVDGLAWQQQDTGVGACATIGLWTMLHSSAFDDHHAIPTTAEITRSAHEKASLGARVFPSTGLSIFQVAEAIKAWDLSPLVIEGDLNKSGSEIGFTKDRFAATCAAFIRSGYPVLLLGTLRTAGSQDGFHLTCAVGFRASGNPSIATNATEIQDSWIHHIYVHDDNIGPNVRFEIATGSQKEAVLRLSAPPASTARQALNLAPLSYGEFVPLRLVIAVHNDLRTSADALYRAALTAGTYMCGTANALRSVAGQAEQGVIVSARFMRLWEYLKREVQNLLATNPSLLARVRLDLVEKVRPMSLHIGVVRIGDASSSPMMDIFFDTTDSDLNHPVFANVAYSLLARRTQEVFSQNFGVDLGVPIDAF